MSSWFEEKIEMLAFRILLMLMSAAIVLYTTVVISDHGWNLVPIFFEDMRAITWPGQFNLDFMCFLILSALWTSWRNGFTGAGIGLGVMALFFGIMFLAPYLIYLSVITKGNTSVMLVGARE